jgi:ferredoxin
MNLVVNPIACGGHGVCAELLPELIELDEWGYPLIDPGEIPAALERQARRAISACPALALKLSNVTARRDRDAARPV